MVGQKRSEYYVGLGYFQVVFKQQLSWFKTTQAWS
jgi:hypothetical protein